MGLINSSVGEDGQNDERDVKVVQRLLNKHSLPPLRTLSVDGKAGKNTNYAIRHFQDVVVKMRSPDGRVDPGGKTIRHLNRGADNDSRDGGGGKAAGKSGGNKNSSKLSGTRWWKANQAKYRNRRGLEYLKGNFKDNATKFVRALKEAKATISVGSTLRHKVRAHLMHYSWRVSKGEVQASDVPSIAGLDIEWDHGDKKASRKGAKEMVRLFNMAYVASTTSNHIKGSAIDMTISWKGHLTLEVPGSDKPVVIRTGPRTGAGNHELHRLARTFGVKKLAKDAPHWSHNGR